MDDTDFEALKLKADSGDSEAQYHLGMEYKEQNRLNPELAKHYLQKAADQGHEEARYEYGKMLESENDFSGAFEQFQKVLSTCIGARLHVAGLLKKGKGVPRNYEEAARLFKSAADENNNTYAQYEYGDCLRKGLGVPKNLEEAEKYFKEAAKGGSVYGLVAYAELLEQRGDSETAYVLYRKAAKEYRSPVAMYHLGKCLECGNGVQKDPVEAARWFKQAAEQGNHPAELKYAECLASGAGVEKDPVEAARWFKQAADRGSHQAELKYAECLASGAGVEKNPVEAAKLFRRAADSGVAEAAIRYSECLKYGIGVTKSPEEARKWFSKAIEVGSGKWLYQLSKRLTTGDGVKKDVKGAREALVAAVDRGVSQAMVEYGKLCGAGAGVKQDPQKAAELYRQAAAKNDANGLCRYAICLEYGNGVEKDLKKAEEMYLEASKSDGDACFFYGRMQERKGDVKEALKWYERASEKKSPFGMIYYGTYQDNGVMGVPMSVDADALFHEAKECLMARFVSKDPELKLVIDEARQLQKRPTGNSVSDFIIESESIERQNEIGYGQYGKVCRAKHKETGELWAAKVVQTSQSTAMADTTLMLREVSMLAMVDHPCILTVKGVIIPSPSSHDWVIATEFMENDSIQKLLHDVNTARAKKQKEPEAWNHTNIAIIIVGIVLGMRHVHRLSVLHRDLKPSNILLDKQYHPHIGDFGLSRIYNDASSLTHEVGTPAYMAPELFEEGAYSNKIDVFSFGLILYELLTTQRAFNEERVYAHIKNLGEGKRPEIPDTVSPGMQGLIKACWHNDPEARPSFAEIYRTLRKIDFKIWDDVDSQAITDYVITITNAEREIRFLNIFQENDSW